MAESVTVYALSTCAYCQAIRKMLSDLGVDHDYLEADLLQGSARTEVMATLKSVNPRCSFPTTVVDGEVFVGFKVQEIKEKLGIRTEVDELYERLCKANEKKGYLFNRNKEQTFQLLRGLLVNKDRYGYMACPCRLASGDREKDRDILCPCDYRQADVAEFGSCFCGLYVSRAWNEYKLEHVEVPERRPVERM
ncbi:MAG TPA: ferredoxin-thioredoxin reductase catalytic domain-containing protein [Desulfopila sp.]|nr:ferredoxin-thioredoxin reductase catalytic domain-containing protein [Desulfopila sp.]